jgi:hypothetical protein
MAAVQAVADRVLAECARVEQPPDPGSCACFSCGRQPVVRISMQLDGTEMFWALACQVHRDEPLGVNITAW